MKRKRRLCFLVALVFVFTLFLSNRVVLGYEAEMVEEGNIEMTEDCSDYVSGYETEIVGVYDIEAEDCNEIDVEQELETEEGIESFNAYPVCPYCGERGCYIHCTETFIFIYVQALFSEGERLGADVPVFIVYEDGREIGRANLRWEEGRGIAMVKIGWPWSQPECQEHREWFLSIIGDVAGEVTWRVELPVGMKAIGETSGIVNFASLPPPPEWWIYNITLELANVTPLPPVKNEAPPPSPQTEDSGAPLVFPLISSIFSLAAIVLLRKRRIIY